MGIEQKLASYFGRRIVVDASMSIYRFLVKKGTRMLTNEAGEVTSHLQGMFYRTILLLEARIKPLYVFDGKPSDLKKQELAKRFSKRAHAFEDLAVAIAVTQQHNVDCKRLLRIMGVRAVEVYAVASEDMDSLTFGAPRFLHHLMDPSSRKVPVVEFEISKILEEMNLDMDQFIDLCILFGCDYCVSIRGISGLTALKLIRFLCSFLIPDNWPCSKAQRPFKEPIVSTEEQSEIKWTAPNEEAGHFHSYEGMASIFSNVLVSCLLEEVASFPLMKRAYMFSMLYYHVYQAIEKIKAAKDESSQGHKCTLRSPNLALKPKTFSTQVSVNSQPRFPGCFKMPTVVLGLRNFKQPLRVVCLPTWI
ncbi:hypothetical protein BT93_L3494 [Corymbia citriodora subsp. variegata]|uniref:Flap endonuclease 1 n=1 Tax=Corymbia citriodora subsp. variegata TaxID=360336 RepID=A0A8T0CVJ8_CORYI|nr:hypothetical protein BT93_L3494 [Corymbia citriodora subsp. variegata]